MQNYLFNYVIQGNLSMTCTFLFWQKNKLHFTIKYCRYSKANNFSPSCAMACSRLSQNVSTFSEWPKARALTFLWEIIYNTLLTTNFFLFTSGNFTPMTLKLISIFVHKWIDLFVSIKPNIQKFTLLIEKVTFQEKQ